MSDFREFPDSNSRQLIDYNRFMELTGNKVFLCLDKGVIEIAKYLLNSRGSWRTTYVKEYVGTIGYTMPTEEEFRNVTNAIAEANIDMASCDDIVTAINGITEALNSGSAGGCGCIGDGSQDVTDVNDGASQEVPDSPDFPPGFADRSEYDSYRCKAAVYVLDNYIQTLRNWGSLFGTVGGLTIAVIAGLLLLTVPPAGLMLIMAALGVLVGVDIALLAILNEIADGLDDNREEIICDIYNAASAEDAAQVLRDAASTVIDDISPDLPDTYKQITDNLISNDAMNVLVTPSLEVAELPEEDCSSCNPALWTDGIFPNDATIISGSYSGPSLTLESVINTVFGFDVMSMDIVSVPDNSNYRLRINAVTAGSGNVKWRYAIGGVDQGENESSDWNDLLDFDEVCSAIAIYATDASPSPTPFEVTFNLVNE